MTDQKLNDKIRRAFEKATPDVLNAVLSECNKKGQGITMTTTRTKEKNRWIGKLAPLAACLCLFVGAGFGVAAYRVNHTVDATVSLDVNPSIEIQVNRKERVLDVVPLNEDGEVIIGTMDFSGSDLNVTVNALIGSMLQNGYLNDRANSILISVDGSNRTRGAALQGRLSEEVNKLLQTDGFNGAVLSQTVAQSEELETLAAEYNITRGRAQLIQEVLRERPLHTFEELAPLSINELNLLLSDTAGAAQVEIVGTASDKGYIGEEKALTAALERAGVSADAVAYYEIGLDTERGVMVYDVEFTAGDYEYECDVNATSGKIVKFEKERADRPASVTSPSAGGALTGGSISETDAKALALARVPGATDADIIQFEQDYDDGRLIYEGKILYNNREYEFEIDAATGAVLDWDSESVYD